MVAMPSQFPPASPQPALLLHSYTALRTPLHVNLILALRRFAFLVVALFSAPLSLSLSTHIHRRGYCSASVLYLLFNRVTHLVLRQTSQHGSILLVLSQLTIGALSVSFIMYWLCSLAHVRPHRSPVLRSACLSNFCLIVVRIPHFQQFLHAQQLVPANSISFASASLVW